MSEEPILKVEKHGRITVARIVAASVLDAVNVQAFGEELLELVAKRDRMYLLLDFSNVDYLSSAVLTELLRINKAVADKHGSFRLCSLNRDIRKVFEITNLDKMFTIYEDMEGGVKRFQRSLDVEAEDSAWGKLNPES